MLTNVRSPRRRLRQIRVRKRTHGTDVRPRLSVFRSGKHIYAQIISDESGRTIVAASTLSPELRTDLGSRSGNKDAARRVGELVARKAIDAGLKSVVFDRNGFLFHGRVKSLAEAAREQGLQF